MKAARRSVKLPGVRGIREERSTFPSLGCHRPEGDDRRTRLRRLLHRRRSPERGAAEGQAEVQSDAECRDVQPGQPNGQSRCEVEVCSRELQTVGRELGLRRMQPQPNPPSTQRWMSS